MGTSVTWHVVSVSTSPGTSRHPPRPIRLAPVPILSVAPATTIHYLPLFRAIHSLPRAETDGGGSASSNPEPNSPTIRRKFHRTARTPAHPPCQRSWQRAPLISAGSTRSDCALVNIGMPHRGTCNWILLSIATWIAHTIAIDAVPSWFVDWFHMSETRKLKLYTDAEKIFK